LSSTHSDSKQAVSEGSVHLDALRGSAALLVFLGHTRALYFSSIVTSIPIVVNATSNDRQTTQANPSSSSPLLSGRGVKVATEAVLIFFVLSGYLVGGSVIRALQHQSWSWRDYLIRRLTRLWVPLIPGLLLCMVLDRTGYQLFGSGSIYHNPPGIDIVTSIDLMHRVGLPSLLGNLLFLQGIRVWYFGTDTALWSLANEF
jgi:peptidoglycan/LPS O-acetylase OafA/YrhL